MQLGKLLAVVGVEAQHLEEVGEELPGLVELAEQDGRQLVEVEHDLVEEVDEEVAVDVRQHLPDGLGGAVLGAFGEEGVSEGGVVGGEALLDDVAEVVEDELLAVPVLLFLHRT